MLIDTTELEQLADEVAGLAGETRAEAVRRALVERRERLAAVGERTPARPRNDRLSPDEIERRLKALDEVQDRLKLTPEAAAAWIEEIRAERDAHRLPADRE